MHVANDDQPITAINVTPLVDIILVVLITFMAAAPLIQRRAMKIDVPAAQHHERAAMEAVSVVYNDKREIYLSGRKVSAPELASRLGRRMSGEGEVQVTLSADKGLAYGDIVSLLDLIRSAGVRRIGLEVKPR